MSDSYRLSLVVTHADGSETRWGSDELEAHNVPGGLSFSTSNPGGFDTLNCDLLRRIDLARPDQNLFDTITVYGPGNEIVWEGRFKQFPRQTSDGYTVSPGGEGWAAHLTDNKAFREIYVDRDLSQWHGATLARKLSATVATYADPSVTLDAATPALTLENVLPWSSSAPPHAEGYYDSGNIPLGALYYAWQRSGSVNTADANWTWAAQLSSDDIFSALDNSGNLRAAGPGTGTVNATGSRYWGHVEFYYAAASVAGNGPAYDIFWTCLAVYGTHGLTGRGTPSATAAYGLYASDVIAHALTNGAPLLTYTTGNDGTIQPTSIVLEQLVFIDPTTTEEVVKRCNAVHLWDWFVWENKTFYFQEPGTGRSTTWTVRLDDGAHLSDDGPAAQDLINGVMVAYTDPSGQRRYAGPVGSGGQVETADLEDTSADNAATAHGITQKWDVLELSQPATDAGAVDIGAVYLAERSTPQHRGQAVVTGMAQHPTQGPRPSWAIRCGDYLQFVDVNDDSIGEPRRIVKTEYDHERRSNTLSLDSSPYTLPALLALLDASLLNV